MGKSRQGGITCSWSNAMPPSTIAVYNNGGKFSFSCRYSHGSDVWNIYRQGQWDSGSYSPGYWIGIRGRRFFPVPRVLRTAPIPESGVVADLKVPAFLLQASEVWEPLSFSQSGFVNEDNVVPPMLSSPRWLYRYRWTTPHSLLKR